jgi:hypothetical protein
MRDIGSIPRMRNGEIREPDAGDRMYVYTDLELSF